MKKDFKFNYRHDDTDWDEAASGNFWRRVDDVVLIVGRFRQSLRYWASVDQDYLPRHFKTLEEAQAAAEKELERRQRYWLPLIGGRV